MCLKENVSGEGYKFWEVSWEIYSTRESVAVLKISIHVAPGQVFSLIIDSYYDGVSCIWSQLIHGDRSWMQTSTKNDFSFSLRNVYYLKFYIGPAEIRFHNLSEVLCTFTHPESIQTLLTSCAYIAITNNNSHSSVSWCQHTY